MSVVLNICTCIFWLILHLIFNLTSKQNQKDKINIELSKTIKKVLA